MGLSAVCVLFVVLLLQLVAGGANVQTEPAQRILQFPKKSVGELFLYTGSDWSERRPFRHASETVQVPAGKRVWLQVGGEGIRSLAWLRQIPDGSIDALDFSHVDGGNEVIAALEKLHSLRELDLTGLRITDEGLGYFGRFRQLDMLNLNETDVKGPGLKHIHAVRRLYLQRVALDSTGLEPLLKTKGLTEVSVGWNRLSAENLKAISSLHGIKGLFMPYCGLSDEQCAKALSAMNLRDIDLRGNDVSARTVSKLLTMPDLTMINAAKTKLTDSDLKMLYRCRHLARLLLAGCELTSAKPIAKLTELTVLDLSETRISDDAIGEIVHLHKLEKLFLVATDISNRCVPQLSLLKSLRELGVSDTKIDSRGVAALKSALPACAITGR